MKPLLIILLMALIAGSVVYFALLSNNDTAVPVNTPTSFNETGILEKNSPGLNDLSWYLLYEKPGNPALIVELSFDNDEQFADLAVGDRVTIVGLRYNDRVSVTSVTKVVPSAEPSPTFNILPYNSGIKGTVSLGPTCPVQRDPPDPACADRPYQTTVQVTSMTSSLNQPIAQMKTDRTGTFSFVLPPGVYSLEAIGGGTFPRCNPEVVTVEPKKYTVMHISCDTGIR